MTTKNMDKARTAFFKASCPIVADNKRQAIEALKTEFTVTEYIRKNGKIGFHILGEEKTIMASINRMGKIISLDCTANVKWELFDGLDAKTGKKNGLALTGISIRKVNA